MRPDPAPGPGALTLAHAVSVAALVVVTVLLVVSAIHHHHQEQSMPLFRKSSPPPAAPAADRAQAAAEQAELARYAIEDSDGPAAEFRRHKAVRAATGRRIRPRDEPDGDHD
ncbi:hypothetical protein ACFCX4_02580 [Kitasatospora sp. NPDC056327]|uniref:hypothetical protein n=1 Tax=Kitasatospora sp. NPDC056327 TaxID=3345785 RepID=UPI0035DD6DF5